MSGIMELAEEMYSMGLSSCPEKNVCASHFSDAAISSFIKTNGHKEKCDYCGKRRKVVLLENLMVFIMDTVNYYYSDPGDFATYENGEYNVTHFEAWEILQYHMELDIDSMELFDDMRDCIDPCKAYADEMAMHDEGIYAMTGTWQHFCYLVKHQVRYLFTRYTDESDIHRRDLFKILNEVGKMISKYNLITDLTKNQKLYRCRQHIPSDIISEASQMYAPEVKYCEYPNRMSPAGISMFYAAFELDTALKETLDLKSVDKTKYTYAEFLTIDKIKVVDLTKIPPLPSIFDQKQRDRYADIRFLRELVTDLTKSIEKDGKQHVEYVPTQIITEFFRYAFGTKVNGIIYPSSKMKGTNAIVLFYNNYECRSILEFLSDTLVTKNMSEYTGIYQ